eukprot:COSAG06_NODE_35755_length_456_cov_0.703081_1_plen_71_part_10
MLPLWPEDSPFLDRARIHLPEENLGPDATITSIRGPIKHRTTPLRMPMRCATMGAPPFARVVAQLAVLLLG